MFPFDWVPEALASLDQRGLRRQRRTVIAESQGRCRLVRDDGTSSELLWNFATNDYLGLSDHPRVIEAAKQALDSGGAGSRASALVVGRTRWHQHLEVQLAELKNVEAVLLFPSGYAANVGAISSLVGAADTVLSDRFNHASLIEGCRLSRARFRVYPHNNLTVLEQELSQVSGPGRVLIVTDSVFSMDGDTAPLRELIALAEQYGAMLLVDEAHATGVFGRRGGGLLEDLPKSPNVVSMGTLSKALGAQGGFIGASQPVIDWIWNNARSNMFSTALSPVACAAASAAIDIVTSTPQMRRELMGWSSEVQIELAATGWKIPAGVCGPIIPLIVGDAERAVAISQQLQDCGLLIPAIRPPTVPRNTSRLRISLSHAHGEQGITALLNGLRQLRS